jgi:hypothetical protein
MGLIAQMFVAYAVSYAVTYIATGSAKAAQGAGLSAALFMGIGGLRRKNSHLDRCISADCLLYSCICCNSVC